MLRTLRRAACLVLGSVPCIIALSACADIARDAPEPADADGAETASGADVDTYCADHRRFVDRCEAPCADAFASKCADTAALLSASMREAFHECADTLACKDGPGPNCVRDKLKDAQPTEAQFDLANRLCTACQEGAATTGGGLHCANGAPFAYDSPGAEIMGMSDKRVADSSFCVGIGATSLPDGPAQCEREFVICAQAFAQQTAGVECRP